jgi:hypothetical protein
VLKSGAKPPLKLATVGHTKVGTPSTTNLPIQNGFETFVGGCVSDKTTNDRMCEKRPWLLTHFAGLLTHFAGLLTHMQKHNPHKSFKTVLDRQVGRGSSLLNAFSLLRFGRDFPHR